MLKFYNIFVLSTLCLFYFGPIPWINNRDYGVAIFVIVCLVLFNAGSLIRIPAGSVARWSMPFPKNDRLAYVVVAVFVLLSLIQLQSITGKNPFTLSSYSLDFGATFREFSYNLRMRELGASEIAVTTLKAVIFPWILLIFVDRFGKNWFIVVAVLIPLIASSILRGTDKEIFDLLLLVGITAYYKNMIGWKVLVYAALIPIFAGVFLLKRLGRFGGILPTCLPGSGVCFNFESNIAKALGGDAEILYVFITNYVAQGYEALSMAFKLPFDFNFFVGHLPPLKRNICVVSEYICDIPDYQQKLTAVGWDTSTRWTSVYPVLANDISLWLVPLYFFMMGYMFRRSSDLWENGKDRSSLVAIILITNFIVFSSANMQVAISLDWVVALIVFVYAGLFRGLVRQR